ncbi:MAG: M56 family metallopeptidase [Oscillospiraceae bacterium]|nr:M56 family metallopeptidase [Oscillospiraceae bacterium]
MDIIGGSLSAAAVIAVIMFMRLALFQKLPKRVLSALWLIAAAKLLLPFGGIAHAETVASDTAVTEFASFAEAAAETVRTVSDAVVNVAVSVPVSGNSLFICECVWLFGAVFVSAFFVFTHIKTRRTFSCALPADYDIAQLKKDFGIVRRVRLLVSDRTDIPLTYGVFAPVIILPKSMELHGEGVRNVLCHELAHIKRFDALFKTVIAVCAAVHWFNPMAWVMFVLANRDVELACDETALRRGKAAPEDYAMSLISVEESRCIPRFPLAGSFAGGKLEERVRGIMTKRKSALAGIFAAVVSATAAAALNVIVMPYAEMSYGMSMAASEISAADAYEYSETTAVYGTAVSDGYVARNVAADYYEISDTDDPNEMVEYVSYSVSFAGEEAMFSSTADEPPQGSYIIVYDFPTFAYAYTTTERGGINSDTVVLVKVADDGSEISKQTRITPISR